MRLPFTIYDGKKSQVCTYEDLFIIVEFNLDATVYSRETEWFGLRHKKHYGMGTLILLYASIKAVMQNNYGLPWGHAITVVDSTRIFSITCKDLHKWRGNPMVRLMMQLEGLF
jgi:hypothetical protein